MAGSSRDARGPTVTAIVAAMPEEMAPLRLRATHVVPLGAGPGGRDSQFSGGASASIVTARLAGQPVVLAVTGDGDRNARQGIAAVLAAVPVVRVIGIGVAGALSGDLVAGALVVSDRVFHEGGDDMHPHALLQADQSLVELAVLRAGARRAVVVTAGRIVDTVAEKARLLHAANAGAEAAVVDLESAAFAAAADRASIPWIVLRAISDTAHEALPELLNRCRDDGGAVRRGKVAFEILKNPGALAILLSLRQRVQQCAGALARATEALLVASVSAPSTVADVMTDLQGGI